MTTYGQEIKNPKSCDVILDSCIKVVKDQKEAIDKQNTIIKDQDKMIQLKEEEKGHVKAASIAGASSFWLVLLLILL